MTTPQDLAEAAVDLSRADDCIVVVDVNSAVNIRWANNAMTTTGAGTRRDVTVMSVCDEAVGRAVGIVSRSIDSLAELPDLVASADRAGRSSPPVADAPELVAPYPHDDAWKVAAPLVRPEDLDAVIRPLEKSLTAWRRYDRALYGVAEQRMTTTFLATSTGLRRRFDQPDGRFELTGKAEHGRSSTWYGEHAPRLAVVDVDRAVAEVERRLSWNGTRLDLTPGRYETILPPTAVADLMVYAYHSAQAFSARDAAEGRSVFSAATGDRRGEQLCPLPISLRSEPAATGIECAPFEVVTDGDTAMRSVFDNGQHVEPAWWITGGRLTDLVRTRAWAGERGESSRAYVGNLILDGGGPTSVDDMIASTDRGLLVTSLWYVRGVDPTTLLLTGLTRDGLYLVENGRVVGAVNNFRFNESPVDLLGRVTEVGRTVHTMPRERADSFRRTAMPPLRIADFAMSTVSSAQ